MVDLIGEAKGLTGIGAGSGGSVAQTLFILMLIILGAIVIGVVTYFVVKRMQYKFKIVIFQKVGGVPQPSLRDKGRMVRLGESGDTALRLLKAKKLLPTPTIQTGIKTFWYYVSDDGEWMNFGPGDFEESRREMGATFLDKEMRYARTSLQAMAKERYDKGSFLTKYGGIIAYGIFILITAIGFYLLLDKMTEVSAAAGGAVEAASAVLEKTSEILGSLDNLQGGSGIVPA